MKLLIVAFFISSPAFASEKKMYLVKNSKIERAQTEKAIRHLQQKMIAASGLQAERMSQELGMPQ